MVQRPKVHTPEISGLMMVVIYGKRELSAQKADFKKGGLTLQCGVFPSSSYGTPSAMKASEDLVATPKSAGGSDAPEATSSNQDGTGEAF
jgi:hypothetical protein